MLDTFKAEILSDPSHNIPLPPLDGLLPAPTLLEDFDSTSVRYQDLLHILNSRRNTSLPGIDMIPYKVYKKCPRITSFLLKLSNVPIRWRIASKVYIPKKKPPNPSAIEDFRPIAFLNVEGKLFFSLIARQLEEHIIQKNRIINLSIQKGCMAKVPGCRQHMSLVWGELETAKSNKISITAVWLDLANAYGSIPHQLIFYSPKFYGINPTWIDLLTSYCNGLWSKSFSTKATSGWQKHFRGIFTGCTASIILFLAGMNVILQFVMAGITSSLSSQFTSPFVKAFMNDLFLMSPSLSKSQDFLNCASLALSWARMSVKASKSKSLMTDSGKIVHDKSLCIVLGANRQAIPSIVDNPVKFLRRTVSDALSDKYQADSLSLALSKGLDLISNSGHCAVQKLWILHHLLVPHL